MSSKSIRLLVAEDLPSLSEIEACCFIPPWSDSQLHSYITGDRFLSVGLWQGGQLNGFALLSTVLDEAELLQIAIRPGLRGKGLAEDVLKFTHDQLHRRGIVRNMLEVRSSNVAALSLYRRLGYQQDGLRKGYYPTDTGREDAVLMSCSNLPEFIAG
ncbi:MAG: ribosomal protein S18-alanine N-acetyltransferase [Amphritea sp.]|nr:ribosomal protein S18-alanine N-acetyltransferase [Amphritea sp.]MBQ0785061.1 ribosomal protein S18-alanine N-acetyltransferase [Amphritea sp.]